MTTASGGIFVLTLVISFAVAGLCGVAGRLGVRLKRRRPKTGVAIRTVAALVGVPCGVLGLYLLACVVAGQPRSMVRPLGNGVTYRRIVRRDPTAVIHVVQIDRPATRRWVVTAPTQTADGPRNVATDAESAADALDADLLINANFFTPFADNFVLSYRPHAGDMIEAIGPVVADGVRYGRPKPAWVSFWAGPAGVGLGDIPGDARAAVTGRQWLLKDGCVMAEAGGERYPRTALALDATRQRMWWVVVDGKQPNYSRGLTYTELAELIRSLGASDAIELDGGGSSVLIDRTAGRPKMLNRPCHTQIPRRLRPTGVFLGLRLGRP